MRLIDPIALKESIALSAIMRDGKSLEKIIDEQPTIQPEPCDDAVSRKTILKFLDSWMSALEDNVHNQSVSDLKIIKKDFENLPSAHLEPHWIPVAERLPNKEEKSYWVCLEGGGQCQCRWTNDMYGLGANEWSKWGWHVMDKPQYSVVVAWRELPESYKVVTG